MYGGVSSVTTHGGSTETTLDRKQKIIGSFMIFAGS